MKKLIALSAFAPMIAMAETAYTGQITPVDTSVLVTSLGTWATSFGPILLGVAGIFAAFWLLRLGLGLLKSIASKSK